MADDLNLLLDLLDQAYDKKSWHGTNLRGSIRGLSAQQAVWRPGPGRKSIWEQVLHAAYWKYTVRRRLIGEKRGSFALKGSNWFPLPATPNDASWRAAMKLLEDEHRALRRAVAGLKPRDLAAKTPGSTLTNLFVITGIACHDIYHAGQIQMIKRLFGSSKWPSRRGRR